MPHNPEAILPQGFTVNMSDIDAANQRLEAALARLEGTLGARKGNGGGVPREDFDRLLADHEALKETSAAVATRLDATIGRLKSLLDG